MSGRRAKQRRRLVWMAASGDEWAQRWVLSHMTPRRFMRERDRHVALEARRSFSPEPGPVGWEPRGRYLKKEQERARRRRQFGRHIKVYEGGTP